jgi:hypothetical protein
MESSAEESSSKSVQEPLDVDLFSFIEQKCTEYFQPDYLSLKSLLNQNGIVDDVLKEIAKYFQWPNQEDFHRERDGLIEIRSAWSALKKYYMIKPFSFDDYLLFVAWNYRYNESILFVLLPKTTTIMTEYDDYEGEYGERVDYISRLYIHENYVISEYQAGDAIKCSFSETIFEEYPPDEVNNLKNFIKSFKIYDAKTFDYYTYIVENLTYFSRIMEILMHFEKDNLQEATMKVYKLLEEKK